MTRASWEFEAGSVITPELTAIRRLGGGEIAEAYVAFDEVTYGPTVVKILRPDQVEDVGALRGLKREADALASINHPVVVRGLRTALTAERPHIVLENIDGPRLSTLTRKHGPLSEHQYLPLGIELASALHYFRGRSYTHLDIKPSNVVMGAPAKLIDLSLARPVDAAERLDYRVGTDAYMAPEQCSPPATGRPSAASDVWGWGSTMYHAIQGSSPFNGDRDSDDLEVRFPQLVVPAPPITVRVHPDVAGLVQACLSPDPAQRPLPSELAEALEPVLARAPRGRLTGFKVR